MLEGSEGPRQPEDLWLQRVQVGAGSIFRGVKGNPADEWVLSLLSGQTPGCQKTIRSKTGC